jgi:diguanylate cyclase (GGDEF)-like protein
MVKASAKKYLTLRLGTVLLLTLHLGYRSVFRQPQLFPDLLLFTFIGAMATYMVYKAPHFNDRYAQVSIQWALALWTLGSLISTFNSFFTFSIWPPIIDICYSLFYPLLLFGLIRSLTVRRAIRVMEVLDTVIIALGFSGIISGVLLRSAMIRFEGSSSSVFLSLLYPVGDITLLAAGITLFLFLPKSKRSFLFLLGIGIFTITDLIFLYLSATATYSFGSIIDDGWLLGLIIVAESLYHFGGETELSDRVAVTSTTIALIFAAIILVLQTASVNFFPKVILIPSFAIIALAFWRSQLAITAARASNEERELARTDELTGIANRRRFLFELDQLLRKEGSLLLLDLDGFKAVNDSHGHETGDQLLKQVAIRFSRATPTHSLLARLGGDEFGVIVFGPPSEGLEVALALKATLTYPFTIKNTLLEVGVSIGRVTNDGENLSSEDLLRRADLAMYRAKEAKTGIVLWQEIR